MLKLQSIEVLGITLLMQSFNWEQPVLCAIAVIGGLVGVIGYQLDQNTLSKRKILIHLCYTLPSIFIVLQLWHKDVKFLGFTISLSLALLITTLTANTIVKNLIDFLSYVARNYFKKQKQE